MGQAVSSSQVLGLSETKPEAWEMIVAGVTDTASETNQATPGLSPGLCLCLHCAPSLH